MNQEWEIKSRAKLCAGTGKPFVEGETVYSRLMFGAEGYTRFDYGEEFWQGVPQADRVGFWKGLFHAPPVQTEALKKENAESMLRKLMETDDPANRNAIYILSVMLERKKILIERDVQIREDGQKIRFYEHKITGETFVVPDPDLRLADLEHVQSEVVLLLGGQPPARLAKPEAAPSAEKAPA